MDQPLHKQKCTPCEGGTPPLAEARVRELLAEVPKWELSSGPTTVIRRTIQCKHFMAAKIERLISE